MKLHSRSMHVGKAHNEVDKAVIDAVEKYELTFGELFGILGQIMSSWSRTMVKVERGEEGNDMTDDQRWAIEEMAKRRDCAVEQSRVAILAHERAKNDLESAYVNARDAEDAFYRACRELLMEVES